MTSLRQPLFTVRARLSQDRGHGNHGWLNSFHTFNFAQYWDKRFQGFHALRVINEDRVTGGKGFGTHSHRDFEIFSYIASGALEHKDSMGNREVLKRGSVQCTSAGRGIQHSEYNASSTELVHFIQIWVKPDQLGMQPRYQTKEWTDDAKRNKLSHIIAPWKTHQQDNSVITIHQDCHMYACVLEPKKQVEYIVNPGRDIYIHVIQDVTGFAIEGNQTGLTIHNGNDAVELNGGDGSFISLLSEEKSEKLLLSGGTSQRDQKPVEFLLFDVNRESHGSNDVHDSDED